MGLREDSGALIRASYLPAQAAVQRLARKYLLDRELSSADTRVWVNRRSGVPVVVHRGSKTARDWFVEDAAIAIGAAQNTARVKKARIVTRLTETKYGVPADAVGHSLGGRLAEVSGAHGEIITFNKAAGLGDLFAIPEAGERQLDVRTAPDAVSLLSTTQQGTRTETIPHNSPVYQTDTERMVSSLASTLASSLIPYPARVVLKDAHRRVASHSARHL
jgi:hypothetical protein